MFSKSFGAGSNVEGGDGRSGLGIGHMLSRIGATAAALTSSPQRVSADVAPRGTRRACPVDDDESSDDDAPLLGKIGQTPGSSPLFSKFIQPQQPSAPPAVKSGPLSAPVDRSAEEKNAQAKAARLSIPAEIAGCKAKIAEMQEQKGLLLAQEDYIGAHHLKEQIQEQEKRLMDLRRQLDSMPTPSRRASDAHKFASSMRVGAGKAGKSSRTSGWAASPGGASSWRATAMSMGASAAASLSPLRVESPVPAAAPPAFAAAAEVAEPVALAAALQTPPPVYERAPPVSKEPVFGEASPEAEGTPAAQDAYMGDADSYADEEEPVEEADDCMEDNDKSNCEAGQWRTLYEDGLVELPNDKGSRDLTFKLPKEIFDRLYPYQRAGVAWMARLVQSKDGGILADEMGLGKTVQICALLNGLRKAGASHALLLLPISLLDQWRREARIWCPGWPVHMYYGSQRQRSQALRRIMKPQGGLLLTSYNLLSNSEQLNEIFIAPDAPSPVRKGKGGGRRPGGRPPVKRRKLDDDDIEDGDLFSDEEKIDPETPGGGLPQEGTTRPWDIVIADEAHRAKNISTQLGRNLRQLKSNCRILLTGTPVQNALGDLWALMDFAQPGLLGNHATFVKHFSQPIDQGSVKGATPFQIELKKHLSEQLRALINPHLLRRTKANAGLLEGCDDEAGTGCEDEVEDEDPDAMKAKKLPPKKETVIWLPPSDVQLEAYKKVLERSDIIREACSKTKLGIEVFRAIGLLKKLCNHPAIVLPSPTASAWAEFLAEANGNPVQKPPQAQADAPMQEASFESFAPDSCMDGADAADVADASSGIPDDGDAPCMTIDPSEGALDGPGCAAAVETETIRETCVEDILAALPRTKEALSEQSSKLRCLASLLPALVERGHRILVFSHSLKMLDLVQICCLRPLGLRCLRIDGGTDAATRAEKVNKFNTQHDRFQCMLLTTNVGGVGLNLTSADRVVLIDPAWNPATDAQAVDRAFRIGQTKEVRVYRLIMSGLIEDKMFRLQVFKMGLTKTALDSSDKSQRYFTAREIRALFEWTDPAEGETRKMLLEKHGDDLDGVVQQLADEDGACSGSSQGWMAAGPAIGISDFALIYGAGSLEEEEEQDDACAAQVLEAKQKLGAADEKLQSMSDAKQAAETELDQNKKDLEQAYEDIDNLKDKLKKADDNIRERRAELTAARRAEAAAATRLDKAHRNRQSCQDAQRAKEHEVQRCEETMETTTRALEDNEKHKQLNEEAFTKVLAEADAQLKIVDSAGYAVGSGVVELSHVDRLRKATRCRESLQIKMDTCKSRQMELEFAEAEVSKADAGLAEAELSLAKGDTAGGRDIQAAAVAQKTAELNSKKFKSDQYKAEQMVKKAFENYVKGHEALTASLQSYMEASIAVTDVFQKARDKGVNLVQVNQAKAAAKAAIRPLSASWGSLRKAREALFKAASLKRKACVKASEATAKYEEAKAWAADAETEYAEAKAEAEAKKADLESKDAEIKAAEASRTQLEVEDAEVKRKRDDLKASIVVMNDDLKKAKKAEKDANLERQALHRSCAKVEQEHSSMELKKKSAKQILQEEEYDETQVEQAAAAAKKSRSD